MSSAVSGNGTNASDREWARSDLIGHCHDGH
jgi:hypothetical protein